MSASVLREAADADGESASPTETTGESLDTDRIFHLLQNERRRLALAYLHEASGPVEMRDLAEQVAAWQNDVTVEALDSDQRQRVYIPLYQNHLPKLAEAGVITYDQQRGVVERQPDADQLDPYLPPQPPTANRSAEGSSVAAPTPDASPPDGHPWSRVYLATATGCGALVAGVAGGVPLLADLPALLISAVVVAAVAVVAIAHSLSSTRERDGV